VGADVLRINFGPPDATYDGAKEVAPPRKARGKRLGRQPD
jgi:hypothetical protein